MRAVVMLLALACASVSAQARELRVTVVGKEGDPRMAAVAAAVRYWNDALRAAGSADSLTLGPVRNETVPVRDFVDPARQGMPPAAPPEWAAQVEGDIVVALPEANFISFTLRFGEERRFIALRSTRHPLLDFPGVADNIAAHELGHALGLPHNADPATLMCGAPAPCRPDRFQSAHGAIFPLTEQDRRSLGQ